MPPPDREARRPEGTTPLLQICNALRIIRSYVKSRSPPRSAHQLEPALSRKTGIIQRRWAKARLRTQRQAPGRRVPGQGMRRTLSTRNAGSKPAPPFTAERLPTNPSRCWPPRGQPIPSPNIAREMGVPGRGLDLGVAEQLPDHRQGFAERQRPRSEGVAHVVEPGALPHSVPVITYMRQLRA